MFTLNSLRPEGINSSHKTLPNLSSDNSDSWIRVVHLFSPSKSWKKFHLLRSDRIRLQTIHTLVVSSRRTLISPSRSAIFPSRAFRARPEDWESFSIDFLSSTVILSHFSDLAVLVLQWAAPITIIITTTSHRLPIPRDLLPKSGGRIRSSSSLSISLRSMESQCLLHGAP